MIILDDFGSGDCNFQELVRLPINSVKISSAFYAGIQSGNTTEKALLAGIVGIAQKLGYEVIAKGVETQVHAEHLLSLGCHQGQGYLYGRPMPIEDLIAFMVKHSPSVLPLTIPSSSPSPSMIRHLSSTDTRNAHRSDSSN